MSLIGYYEPHYNLYVIARNDGLIVLSPDYLVSGTTITQSLFCRRKAVLCEKFKDSDAGNLDVIGLIF